MSALTVTSAMSSITAGTPSGLPVQQMNDELPHPSTEAADFLESIEERDVRHLVFEDNLVTVSDAGKELGEFSISVTPTRHQGQQCWLVHANSHGAIDGVPCGTSITAHVTDKLQTLQQQHHEYVKLENHPLDRKTFIVREQDGYVVNRVVTQGQDVQRASQNFPFEQMHGFVSEGSSLLLQRLLIKKGLPENFQLLAFDSESNLCPVVYRALEPRIQVVQSTELEVTGIERTINALSDLPTTWQAYFTRDGQMTSRVQVGSPVTMRLLTVPQPIQEEEVEEKPTFEKKPLNWEEDMELYSTFLDRKAELKGDHATYMRQHPELHALLADFLQFLLLRKPDDVLEFAADYFSSFSSHMPSNTPYQQSNAPSPYPCSRSNSKIQYLAKTPTSLH